MLTSQVIILLSTDTELLSISLVFMKFTGKVVAIHNILLSGPINTSFRLVKPNKLIALY
jgi:hypothetical protein